MTHIPYATPHSPIDFSNRKSGLLVFGILLILLGSLSACAALTTPLALLVSRLAPPNANASNALQPRAIAVAVPLYLLIAGGLIWTGIGSILAQRWVRPIVLSFTIIFMFVGIFATIAMLILLPTMSATMQAAMPPGSPPVSQVAVAFAVTFGALFSVLFYLVIPGIFFWFYRKQDVRRTLEFYDPVSRWTDRCPLPVLGMSIAATLMGISALMALAYPVVLLFGVIITGNSARAMILLTLAVYLIAAVLIYRQRMAGWWLAMGMLTLLVLSVSISMMRVDLITIFEAMDLPQQQLDILRANPIWTPGVAIPMTAVAYAAYLGYAIYVRRYFHSPTPVQPPLAG